MATVQLRVGSFNVGSGWSDFQHMIGGDADGNQKNALKEIFERERPADIKALMQKQGGLTREEHRAIGDAEVSIQERLQSKNEASAAARLMASLDVICLQEVKSLNRVFARTLLENGFTIIPGKNVAEGELFSTAIALRNGLFSKVEDISIQTPLEGRAFYGQEIAAVRAELKDQDVSLAFSSLHSWGFQLYAPGQKKVYSSANLVEMKAADAYVKHGLDLMKGQDADFILMGADMNNNPDNYKNTFDLIDKEGFVTLDPGVATNINQYDESYKLRTIDFLFEKKISKIKEVFKMIASIFISYTKIYKTEASVLDTFSFSVDGNCSDHLPIRATLTIRKEDADIKKAWKKFSSLWS